MFDWKMMMSRLLKVFDVRRIYSRIRSSVRSNWILYGIVLGYIIIMSTVTIMKHNAFLTSGFDLGIFNQAFSTTLFDGKLFYETADLSFNPSGSFFGVHFSPILFLLLPFYAIYPSVENLLVMQTVILALGAFPIYWMARDKLGKKVAPAISALYLIYPAFVLLNLNDFRLEAFTSTFFLFSVYYLEQEKWPHFFTFMFLAIFTIEFAPIIGVSVALYACILYFRKNFQNRRKARMCIVIAAVMTILFIIIALKTKETFNNSTSPISSTFSNILLNPAELPSEIVADFDGKMLYLISFLAPLAFLPVLAPEPLIMALPWIGLSFMSPYTLYHYIFYQYTGFVIPFVMIALPKAVKRLNLHETWKIVPLLLAATLICWLYLPISAGSPWNYQLPVADERTQMIHEMLALIPPDASILTENDLFPHVSNRPNAYMSLPEGWSTLSIKYVFVDINSGWYKWQADTSGGKITPIEYIETVLGKGDYGVLASARGLLLLEKDYTGEPVLFEPYDLWYNYEKLFLRSGSVIIEDPTSSSGQVLFHSEKDPEGNMWYGPYIDLTQGLYKVTYRIKVDNASKINPTDYLLTVDATKSFGSTVLAVRKVNGSDVPSFGQWFDVSLFFVLRAPDENIEFRGFVVSNLNISLDHLKVEQISAQPLTGMTFNFEDFFVDNGTVTEGAMVHSQGSGTFWYGPYTSLPKGNYTAKFWLKLNQPYIGTLLDIGVSINGGKKALTTLTISGSDFKKIDAWQSFKIKFTLQEDSNSVEFPGMNVRETAPISFLLVDVYPDTFEPYNAKYNYEKMALTSGSVIEDPTSSSGQVLFHSEKDPEGNMWYGPYANLSQGLYKVTYVIKVDNASKINPSEHLLTVDAAKDVGQTLLAEKKVNGRDAPSVGQWFDVSLFFGLNASAKFIEFRGWAVSNLKIYLDYVKVEQISTQPLRGTMFNFEDFFVEHGTVTEGVMVHSQGSGTFWYGPYTSLPKGNYTAKFWLRLDQSYEGTLLDIGVSINYGKKALTTSAISNSNFTRVNAWQSFEVKFTLQEDSNGVEFPGMNVRETAPISFLLVDVYPDTGG